MRLLFYKKCKKIVQNVIDKRTMKVHSVFANGDYPHRALRPGGKDGRHEECRAGALNINPSRLAGREKTATVREDSKEAMP